MANPVILPGRPAPWMLAFCGSCRHIAEQVTRHPATEPGWFWLTAKCHGKTETARVTESYLLERWRTGRPFIMFKGPLQNLVNAVVAEDSRRDW